MIIKLDLFNSIQNHFSYLYIFIIKINVDHSYYFCVFVYVLYIFTTSDAQKILK
jgi:hypothetical protein